MLPQNAGQLCVIFKKSFVGLPNGQMSHPALAGLAIPVGSA
jgi:hypothetical protein